VAPPVSFLRRTAAVLALPHAAWGVARTQPVLGRGFSVVGTRGCAMVAAGIASNHPNANWLQNLAEAVVGILLLGLLFAVWVALTGAPRMVLTRRLRPYLDVYPRPHRNR
jgi:hypothetical protein